uniref:Uncharacterized protein n=1 Tax=Arundo donax TaxID=35708 RepID=A0A0A9TDN2_ARUDO
MFVVFTAENHKFRKITWRTSELALQSQHQFMLT